MLWRQLARGLRALIHRADVDEELDEEIRDYFDRARVDLERAGLSPQDAARAARRQLGDVSHAREALRSYGWEHAVETVWADLRYALRRLGRSPGFAAVVVLTPEAMLISESFAKRRFGDRDPLGQRVRFGRQIGREDGRWRASRRARASSVCGPRSAHRLQVLRGWCCAMGSPSARAVSRSESWRQRVPLGRSRRSSSA